MTAISNDQAKIHIEAMLGELLRHDADENHPRILAMQKAIAALAPPSGEGMDEDKRDAIDGVLNRLEGWGKAYPIDMFGPITDEEHAWLHNTRPGLTDRISASMGRYMAEKIAEDIAILRNIITPQSAPADAVEMSPEFTDSARGAIAWVLYHHQGGSSAIGQPLRFALGMGEHELLPDWRIAEAKRWANSAGAKTSDFLTTPPPASQERVAPASTEAAAVAHHGTGENSHHSEPVPNGLEIQSASTYSDGDAFNRTLCASPPSSAAAAKECTRNCDCIGECKAGMEARK